MRSEMAGHWLFQELKIIIANKRMLFDVFNVSGLACQGETWTSKEMLVCSYRENVHLFQNSKRAGLAT